MKFNCTDPLTLQTSPDRTKCTLFFNYGDLKFDFTASTTGVTKLQNLGASTGLDLAATLSDAGWLASTVAVETGTEKCTASSMSAPSIIAAVGSSILAAWFF